MYIREHHFEMVISSQRAWSGAIFYSMDWLFLDHCTILLIFLLIKIISFCSTENAKN